MWNSDLSENELLDKISSNNSSFTSTGIITMPPLSARNVMVSLANEGGINSNYPIIIKSKQNADVGSLIDIWGIDLYREQPVAHGESVYNVAWVINPDDTFNIALTNKTLEDKANKVDIYQLVKFGQYDYISLKTNNSNYTDAILIECGSELCFKDYYRGIHLQVCKAPGDRQLLSGCIEHDVVPIQYANMKLSKDGKKVLLGFAGSWLDSGYRYFAIYKNRPTPIETIDFSTRSVNSAQYVKDNPDF